MGILPLRTVQCNLPLFITILFNEYYGNRFSKTIDGKMFPNIDWESIGSFEAGEIICKYLSKYIENTVQEANKYDEFFVFEGSSIDIVELCRSLNTSSFEMVLIAYPNVTVEGKFRQIRTYESNDDWTTRIIDERLKSICRQNIENSHKVEKIAKEYDLLYFDVSYESRDEVVKIIIDGLIKKGFMRKEVEDRSEELY